MDLETRRICARAQRAGKHAKYSKRALRAGLHVKELNHEKLEKGLHVDLETTKYTKYTKKRLPA